MSLTIDDVTRIAKEAAGAVSPALQVAGVTLGGSADSDYIEILLNVDGCRTPPCQLEVGVFRNLPEPSLRDEVMRKLRQHLAEYRTQPGRAAGPRPPE